MRTTKELKEYFLEKYPQMDDCIADAVSTLMLSREELLEEAKLKTSSLNLSEEFKNEWAKRVVEMNIKTAEELLSEAKPAGEY